MSIRSSFFLSFYLFLVLSSSAQEKGEAYEYARRIVDTMASVSMHGRGYVNEGDRIAADYIRNEFKKMGVQPLVPEYFQHFIFPVNSFPKTVKFEFGLYAEDGMKGFYFKGQPGKNFIVDPSSPSVFLDSDVSVKVFDSTFCNPKAFKKFIRGIRKYDLILVDEEGVKDKHKKEYFEKIKSNAYGAAVIIELVKKLIWDQAQSVYGFSRVLVLSDSCRFEGKKRKGKGNIEIENLYIPQHTAQNVLGCVTGSVHPDSFIVFSAHYDHLGQMGRDAYFPGANDNASGCAMMLNLARYYSRPENKPKYSVAFMAFAGEEVGLLGSKYYTEHPVFPLKNIRFELNMDIMGTGEEGITVVNGTVFKPEFDALKQININQDLLKEVKLRGKAANSDHYFFSEKGVKAFFIYTMGGIKAYHDIYDKAETLPLNEFENLFKLITAFGDYLQN